MNSPIVLIHGLWLTPRSWEGWKARFEQRGHEVLAPAWPCMEREVEALRRDPSVLNGLGVTEVVDHYDRIIRGLDTPPVIMGHSFGGLITELLLDRGLGVAGVAISPAQVKGVLHLPAAQIRTVWPALRNPANSKKTVPLTPKQAMLISSIACVFPYQYDDVTLRNVRRPALTVRCGFSSCW